MSRDSFVGDAMSPSPYAEARAEVERLRDRLAEEAMRNREMREECDRLRRDLAECQDDLTEIICERDVHLNGRLIAFNEMRAIRKDLAAAREALRSLLGEVGNIEVLGEWSAEDRNHSSARKYRARVNTVIDKCHALLATTPPAPLGDGGHTA